MGSAWKAILGEPGRIDLPPAAGTPEVSMRGRLDGDLFEVVIRRPSQPDVAVAAFHPALVGPDERKHLVLRLIVLQSGSDLVEGLAPVFAWLKEWAIENQSAVEVHGGAVGLADAARWAGFRQRATNGTVWSWGSIEAHHVSDLALWPRGTPRVRRSEILAASVARLVDHPVRAVRENVLQRMAWRARYAQFVLMLEVQDRLGSWHLVVPDRCDLSPGRLAAAVATLTSVRQRFAWVPIKRMTFSDMAALHSDRGVSGFVVQPALLELHIADDLATSAPYDPAPDAPLFLSATRTVAGHAGVPWLVEVVVHEAWHLVEHVFEARDYRRSVQFRRAVGQLIGLETLEHAYEAGRTIRKEDRQRARTLLQDAVGSYALTSRWEATAELFTAWSFAPNSHPLVTAFGELINQQLGQ